MPTSIVPCCLIKVNEGSGGVGKKSCEINSVPKWSAAHSTLDQCFLKISSLSVISNNIKAIRGMGYTYRYIVFLCLRQLKIKLTFFFLASNVLFQISLYSAVIQKAVLNKLFSIFTSSLSPTGNTQLVSLILPCGHVPGALIWQFFLSPGLPN